MTTTTNLVPAAQPEQPNFIRTDAVGRIRRSPEQRERILDEYERSGLSGPKFAALCGVAYQTFASWLARRKRQRLTPSKRPSQRKPSQVQWLEASVQSATPGIGGLLLQLPGGVQARVSDPGQIVLAAALMRALEKPC